MKSLLLLLAGLMLFASCSNDLVVQLDDLPTKVVVTDYDNVYSKFNTVMVIRDRRGQYHLSNNPGVNTLLPVYSGKVIQVR